MTAPILSELNAVLQGPYLDLAIWTVVIGGALVLVAIAALNVTPKDKWQWQDAYEGLCGAEEPATPVSPSRVGARAVPTTKSAKLADSDDGARQLEWLLDRIEGEDRPTRGNGTYRPEHETTTAGAGQQKDTTR